MEKEKVHLTNVVGDFRFVRKGNDAGYSMKEAHYHPYYELGYLKSGEFKIFINHTVYKVKTGDMIFLTPLEIHRATEYGNGSNERYDISFSEDFLLPLKQECGEETVHKLFSNAKVTIPASRREYVEELLRKMEHVSGLSDEFTSVLKKMYLYELLIFAGRYGAMNLYEDMIPPEENSTEQAIQRSAAYICQNYDKNITLDDMAKMVHMSPTYFSRKFKKVTGLGFKEYLNQIRIREASLLLLKSNASVTEIACRCGFNDGNYFGDAFRKAKGMSPGQYRKSPEIL
ncbi:MAG: AraC family transcriptional regulator [bacterium]|nr:AraC family transcriptional regulator [bacterium]